MIGLVRRHVQQQRATGDEGIALVVAIALIAVVGMLIASIITVAVYESGATGRDRQRSQAVMAAEQAVDTLMAQVQGTSLGSLPCGDLTDESVSVVSDRLTVAPEVRFYDQAGNVLDCTAVQGGTTRAYTASIRATATSEALNGQTPAVRTVEMLLELNPFYGLGLDKAIFGDAGVTLANHASIYGENGQPNADLYTNGNVTCNNNQHYYGSIYAQGSVSMSNTCVVEVNVHARAGFSGTNPGVAVNGQILVSNGNISLTKAQVGQQARASGSVSGDICSTPNKCFGGVAVPPPPVQPFPILNWNSTVQAEWAANGFTRVEVFPRAGYACGMYGGTEGGLNGKVDNVARWLVQNMATLTTPTIIVSNCPGQPVKFQGNAGQADLKLKTDIAIFAQGGVNFSNKTLVTSADGTDRRLYLIQPYDSVSTHPCYADGISLDNQVTVNESVDVLLYSPCSVRKANNTTHYGQIYAGGNATIDNKLTMYYKPLPVWGVSGGTTIESYTVEIQYKREDV